MAGSRFRFPTVRALKSRGAVPGKVAYCWPDGEVARVLDRELSFSGKGARQEDREEQKQDYSALDHAHVMDGSRSSEVGEQELPANTRSSRTNPRTPRTAAKLLHDSAILTTYCYRKILACHDHYRSHSRLYILCCPSLLLFRLGVIFPPERHVTFVTQVV